MGVNMNFSRNMDDEYEKLFRRMNPPRVVIDNESCKNATVIRVDSANKHGILLEVVQILTDLNLIITKAYISSDGGWFMDVFNVTDHDGKKVTDEAILKYIRKSLGPESCSTSSIRSVGVKQTMEHTAIELLGSDRPGLLSEVSAVLTNLKCNIVNAEVWTHNTRAAAVMHVTDEKTGSAITDPQRLSVIKELLCNVLAGGNRVRGASSVVTEEVTHTERRLHQMMFADRDYERVDDDDYVDEKSRPKVTVVNLSDNDYSVVTIQCKDRAKLLFDIVFTLTDMQYVVFHASIDSEGPNAYQEYYIKHIDGSPVKSDAERHRVIQCLEAAIKRRVSEGLKLELCATDRVGLLSDVTRIIRENSLTVTRAEVTTKGGKAVNTFYVGGASGCLVESKTIESIRQAIGNTILKVKGKPEELKPAPQDSPTRFLFGGLFKSRSFANFGMVKSYS
ncbi:ACT domain-containing protein ACR4 isoform X2 [Cajanus cajan]|uniref:ACT domain-containing protein ACR4 isoform X2 n=1 Tax=Cajanus cajan TaxID=3821 RepID=UPI00098DA21B|nr:ACT domain-containing protein ACR4 isoform X2 [Cajanus cajan]